MAIRPSAARRSVLHAGKYVDGGLPEIGCPKEILERGKSPEFSEGMQNAMSEADFSKTMAVAVNFKGLLASESFAREFRQNMGNNSELKGLAGMDEQFLQDLLGLSVDASLDSLESDGQCYALVQRCEICRGRQEDARRRTGHHAQYLEGDLRRPAKSRTWSTPSNSASAERRSKATCRPVLNRCRSGSWSRPTRSRIANYPFSASIPTPEQATIKPPSCPRGECQPCA